MLIPGNKPLQATPAEAAIIVALDRLYWLITQATGVAVYSDDVVLFTKLKDSVGKATPEDISVMNGYIEDWV